MALCVCVYVCVCVFGGGGGVTMYCCGQVFPNLHAHAMLELCICMCGTICCCDQIFPS